MIYDSKIKKSAIKLRQKGLTYSEIQNTLNLSIPKGTLSGWLKDIKLTKKQQTRINEIINKNLKYAREKSKQKMIILDQAEKINLISKYSHLKKLIRNKDVATIAFTMLCYGEASKNYSKRSPFYLGSSNPKIIKLFIELLKICFPYNQEKIRCTVQCRADQNKKDLENYWQKQTNIPKKQFYKTRIDPRTKDKPTQNKSYKGVLRVDYFDSKVPKSLDVLYNLLSEAI